MPDPIANTPYVKSAHFEVFNRSILDLYFSHAGLAHDAHQAAADGFYELRNPRVELVGNSVLTGEKSEKLSSYDVVSFSEGYNPFGSAVTNIESLEGLETIILGSAGNQTEKDGIHAYLKSTPFDKVRNYAAVGEASFDSDGKLVIDKSNNMEVIAFLANNPYDEAREATTLTHYPDSVELDAHRDLVEKYVTEVEGVFPATRGQFEARVDELVLNPELLHEIVAPELKRLGLQGTGDKQYGLEGTSFAAPTAAGYFTALIEAQRNREALGQTFLTNDEVFMVGYASTEPVSLKDGSLPIKYQTNARGMLTASQAGFGYLNPELLKKNIAVAIERKEAGLTQDMGEYKGSEMLSESKEFDTYELNISPQEAGDMNVFKLVLNINTESRRVYTPDRDEDPLWDEVERRGENLEKGVMGAFPIKIISPQGTVVKKYIEVDVFGKENSISLDEFMGEELAGKWTIVSRDENNAPFIAATMQAHTYEKGGFIDKLIDEKAIADQPFLAAQTIVEPLPQIVDDENVDIEMMEWHHQAQIDGANKVLASQQLSHEISDAYKEYYSDMTPENQAKYEAGLNLVREMNEFQSDVTDVKDPSLKPQAKAAEVNELEQAMSELRQAFEAAIENGFSVSNEDVKPYEATVSRYR